MKKNKKRDKILVITLCLIGLFGIFALFVAPVILIAIDPAKKFAEASVKSCSQECGSDTSNQCVLTCLEKDGTIEPGNECSTVCAEATDLPQCLVDNCIPPR
jgi:hypothetical protein